MVQDLREWAPTFRGKLISILLLGALIIAAALALIARGSWMDGLLLAAAAILLLRWYWRSTQRQRDLSRRGYYTGLRVGTHWVYEELHRGEVRALQLPLAYVGRGEYEIHIAGERDWVANMPGWARERRAEIVERLQAVFKRSQIQFDADSAPDPPS
jgi:hypothetical protein